MTKESHFFLRTDRARSTAGSIKATTLRRGPSLLKKGAHGWIGIGRVGWDETYCSKRNEWFQGPSSDPELASRWVSRIKDGKSIDKLYRTEHDITGTHEHDVEIIGSRTLDCSEQRVSVIKPVAHTM